MAAGSERVHATAIALGPGVVLLRGPSGAGKSDLALRCLTHAICPLVPAQAELVADDQVLVTNVTGRLTVSVPAAIRGKMEVRGFGIIEVTPAVAREATVVLVADLVSSGASIDRLPDPTATVTILGISVPLIRVAPFEASAASKVLIALQHAVASNRA